MSQIEIMSNPKLYIRNWLETQNITIADNGSLVDENNRRRDHVAKIMWLDYQEMLKPLLSVKGQKTKELKAINKQIELAKQYNSDSKIITELNVEKTRLELTSTVHPFPQKDLDAALDVLIEDTKIAALVVLRENVKVETENLAPLRVFVEIMTGAQDEIAVLVMAHFMWQIKRKLFKKKAYHHIMPIIYGKQGAGKSTAIGQLISPFINHSLLWKVTDLNEPQKYRSLGENFVCVMDELQGADKSEINAIKSLITAQYTDSRTLYTQQNEKNLQNCTFIGTTNKPVNLNFFDSTGMRRFFEIKSTDKMQIPSILAFDPLPIWKGIDENREVPYIDSVLSQIQVEQEKLTSQDEITLFLETEGYGAPVIGEETEVSAGHIFKEYILWANENNFNPTNIVMFGKRLNALGILKHIRKNAGSFYIYSPTSETSNLKILPFKKGV